MIIKALGYRVLWLNVLLAGVYFLLAEFGLWFATIPGNVTLIWLPAGLALATLLLGGLRYIPCIFIGAFAAGIAVDDSIPVSLTIALGNTLEPLFAWYLLTKIIKFDILLHRLTDFLLLSFFAAPLSAVLSALARSASFLLGDIIKDQQLVTVASNWWMADTLGIILMTPLILAWLKPLPCVSNISLLKKIIRVLPLPFAFLIGQLIFLDWFKQDAELFARPELMFLCISWVAMTLSVRGVTLVLVMTAIQALISARLGIGYFADDLVHAHLLHFWFYFLTLAIVGITLATYISEHQHAKNALQESENRFRQLLQDIPSVAVQSYNKDGKILYWNKASERLYGYTSEEALGRDIAELLIPTKTQSSYKYAIDEMFKAEQPTSSSMELSLLNKDGVLVEVFVHHAFVQSAEPEIFCMAINMTEYKRVEAISRRNENYLRSLLNTIPDLVWLKNTEGVYLFCNPMFERFLGSKSSEIIDKTDYDFITNEQANCFRESDLTTIAKGMPHTIEQHITFADTQKDALLEITKTPMYSDEGELIGILGIGHDITERKHIEEKLRASENRLRSIIDVSPVPMALSDKQHRITFLNPAFEQTLGYTTNDINSINDWWQKACPDLDYRELAQRAWQSAIEQPSNQKQTVPPIEFEVTCKSGEIKTMLISAAAIEKTMNSVYLIVFYDISDHKKYDEVIMHNQTLLKEREGYQRALLNNFPFLVWFKDINNHFLAVNQAFAKSLGASDIEEVIGKSDLEFYPPEIAKQHLEDDLAVITSRQKKTIEEEHVDPIGISTWTETYKAPVINDDNEVIGTVGFSRDITERKNNETDLRIAATAFESQDGMFITDANRIILRVNRAFTMVTGYSAEEVIGQTPNLFTSGQQEDFYAELWDCIFASGAWQGEIWSQRKDGDIYLAWLMVTPVKDKQGVITHYVTVISDITVRKEAEEQIKQFAFYDSLTRLPNRRKLSERLEHSIAVAKREKGRFAVLMLDLDRFKAVNDSFGHSVGDELLQQVAERISKRLRNTDTVARLGGDEFIVLLVNITRKEDAARVAEALVEDIGRPFQLSQGEVQIGTSIGISLYPEHGDVPEILMDNADVALYQAKNSGRGCYAYFTENLTLATKQRLQIETKLRRGLTQQELRVFYQPQVDIQTGQIIGAEALVRWQVFNELILPNYFIPVAEETSLIIDIGAWVLYETCHQGKVWLDQGLPPVILSVNVSSPQIKRSNIVGLVASALKQTGFPPQYLELEITERGLLESSDADIILDILNKLHNLGIRLAIDNFGTGYSSLSYLKRFPVNTLKIDRSFIKAISQQKDTTGIATTIINMAHSLGFKVLAEGVETPEQLEFLRDRGCDYYQGYIKSKPIPATEFLELLRGNSKLNPSSGA